ncbi:hypothetical protein EZV62_008661 [Acer yangbiense]|uniref:ABC transmembrane type-1 domain-containing protein n=1 Tax=Acer yangbiense TaxID=1000413 RepID=A0A5C7IG04_9ROSI|nr:hypothetical protein EZV62_008661 [Acer yangbiense]
MELRFVTELLGVEEDENGVGSLRWWRSGRLGFQVVEPSRTRGGSLEWCLVVGKVNNLAMVVYKPEIEECWRWLKVEFGAVSTPVIHPFSPAFSMSTPYSYTIQYCPEDDSFEDNIDESRCIAAIGSRAVQPINAYCVGSLISIYFRTNKSEIKSESRTLSLVFLGIAALNFISSTLQHYSFAVMGERLTKRVREKLLEKMMSFEIGWFDQKENTSAAICARLATEANMVRSLVGDRMSLLVQAIFGSILAYAIGLVLSWKLMLVMIAVQPVVIGSYYARKAGSSTNDLSKGSSDIRSVFTILDRNTEIDPETTWGRDIKKDIRGRVKLKNVFFSYPARLDQLIFKGLNLKIEAGRTVALVGQIGSGKSTIIGLIERFYDPSKGSVFIDEQDIKNYNLRKLRESEIKKAAFLANAHEFISGMKDGYDTYCGERGVQLSGGQKQRIALARAILKNPAILLLDETTSALDSASESLVQEALEKMMVGRTSIVVAHRLSTIQKADTIAIIKNGKVAEQGTHNELLSFGRGGAYYSLIKL